MLEEKSDVCDTKRIAEKQAAERAYKTLVVGRLEHIYLIEGVPRGLQGVPRGVSCLFLSPVLRISIQRDIPKRNTL